MPLSPELIQQIENEALAITVRLKDNNDYQAGYIRGILDGYEQGATIYTEKWQDGERRNKEAFDLLSPLLDYGHSKEAKIPLGASITSVILERAKAAAEMAEALKEARETINWMWDNCRLNEGKEYLQSDMFNKPANAIEIADAALQSWTAIGEADKKEVPGE